MMCVTVADVFMRYVFNSPVRGSYDMVEATLVRVRLPRHVDRLSPTQATSSSTSSTPSPLSVASWSLIRLADLLTVVTLLALFAYAMITPALQSYGYGERKLELRLPIYIAVGRGACRHRRRDPVRARRLAC